MPVTALLIVELRNCTWPESWVIVPLLLITPPVSTFVLPVHCQAPVLLNPPAPAKVPLLQAPVPLRLNTPVAVTVPPEKLNAPLMSASCVTSSEPPVTVSVSLLTRSLTFTVPVRMVTVTPGLLINTLSVLVGTNPVLQFEATSQNPLLLLIHVTVGKAVSAAIGVPFPPLP